MKMQLSKRLEAIARMVSPGNRLVDVGCDHGYLPIALTLRQVIPSAIAMDVRPGPLARAKENIDAYGLNPYIETRLSDGLEALEPGEGDTLSIAGMGGPLMERILTKDWEVSKSFRELILQPQSEICHFRKFLLSNGFDLKEEDMVLEDGKYYFILRAVPASRGSWNHYRDIDYHYGRFLLQHKNPVLLQFLERELRKNETISGQLARNANQAAQVRQKELREERQRILSAMREYENQ